MSACSAFGPGTQPRTAYLQRQRGGTAPTASSTDDGPAVQEDRRCIACEKPLPPGSRSHRRTCSAAYRQDARRWSRLASPDQFLQPPADTCEFCQGPFPTAKSWTGLRHWCSYLCGQRARRGLDPTQYRLLTCEHCQEPIERALSGQARRWCSRSCREKAQRRRRKSANDTSSGWPANNARVPSDANWHLSQVIWPDSLVVSQDSAFVCIDPSGVGPRLFFQRVPEGKVVKNRLHLDVRVGTGLVGEERLAALEAECARLVALGAVRVRLLLADGVNESCLVMQDIEGNEFCLD